MIFKLDKIGQVVQNLLNKIGVSDLHTGNYTTIVGAVNKLWEDAHYQSLTMSVSPASWIFNVGDTVSERIISITLEGTKSSQDSAITLAVVRGDNEIARFDKGTVTCDDNVSINHVSGSNIYLIEDNTVISSLSPNSMLYSISCTDDVINVSTTRRLNILHRVYVGYSEESELSDIEDMIDSSNLKYKTTITESDIPIVKHSGNYMYFVIPSTYRINKIMIAGAEETFTLVGSQSVQEGLASVNYNFWRSTSTGISPAPYTLTLTNA